MSNSSRPVNAFHLAKIFFQAISKQHQPEEDEEGGQREMPAAERRCRAIHVVERRDGADEHRQEEADPEGAHADRHRRRTRRGQCPEVLTGTRFIVFEARSAVFHIDISAVADSVVQTSPPMPAGKGSRRRRRSCGEVRLLRH